MWKPGSAKPAPAPASKQTGNVNAKDAAPVAETKRTTTKAALSQKTLAMKFMQRKKVSDAQKLEAAKARQQEDTWMADADEDTTESDELVCFPDVRDPSLPTVFARRSFGGFNKAVEDEYRVATRQLKLEESEARELREEVSAEDMAARMIKYTGLMRGPASSRGNGGANKPNKRQRK
ncbi:TPA: hypothetical protein N0F65_001341 [Lagenidium giganteum]|uniref:M-phase phosphoprotein 6 n=1 Tax=Lagenidium giganteum TaxID=4803 RepID=A0AAV2YV34_9STRA|nr:TPA: hypothetical protein N0F65_001341 [Lagenidium giganteum]